jgi:hypothetical protein
MEATTSSPLSAKDAKRAAELACILAMIFKPTNISATATEAMAARVVSAAVWAWEWLWACAKFRAFVGINR